MPEDRVGRAMRLTAASGIVSGETGAAGLGGLFELLRRGGESPDQEEKARRAFKRALRLDSSLAGARTKLKTMS